MTSTLATPTVHDLPRLHAALCGWQGDGMPLQLHPGDLGWFSLRGEAATAAAMRVWSLGSEVAAIGLLDGEQLLRLAIAPDLLHDAGLAARIAADVDDAAAGVLGAQEAVVEARGASALGIELDSRGWRADEPWTPLHLDLGDPVDVDGLRIRSVAAEDTEEWVRVHWSAFRGTPIPEDRVAAFVDGWGVAARGALFGDARILALHDDEHGDGAVVAVAAVWPAGEGRPGLVEPLAVDALHRGRGHGVRMTRAAAAALRELGASSAIVCAESSNAAAVATYVAAGFTAGAEVADWARGA